MSIEVQCPRCGRYRLVSDSYAGQLGQCECGEPVRVPFKKGNIGWGKRLGLMGTILFPFLVLLIAIGRPYGPEAVIGAAVILSLMGGLALICAVVYLECGPSWRKLIPQEIGLKTQRGRIMALLFGSVLLFVIGAAVFGQGVRSRKVSFGPVPMEISQRRILGIVSELGGAPLLAHDKEGNGYWTHIELGDLKVSILSRNDPRENHELQAGKVEVFLDAELSEVEDEPYASRTLNLISQILEESGTGHASPFLTDAVDARREGTRILTQGYSPDGCVRIQYIELLGTRITLTSAGFSED